MQFVCIRMVFGGGEDLQNSGTLARHAHAAIPQHAFQFFDTILVLFHGRTLAKGTAFENS
ncbi:hypothetical protein D3C71_2062350 [compost metagenome]